MSYQQCTRFGTTLDFDTRTNADTFSNTLISTLKHTRRETPNPPTDKKSFPPAHSSTSWQHMAMCAAVHPHFLRTVNDARSLCPRRHS